MKGYKTYKFRLYPSEKQIILIHKTFGCVRLVYNYYLAKQRYCNKKSKNNQNTVATIGIYAYE